MHKQEKCTNDFTGEQNYKILCKSMQLWLNRICEYKLINEGIANRCGESPEKSAPPERFYYSLIEGTHISIWPSGRNILSHKGVPFAGGHGWS